MNKTIQHILEEGKNSGFSVVEAFAEKTERQEYECFAGDIPRPAGTAVHRTCHTEIGRIATRAFWETGDPVGFSLSKPGLKEIKNAFSNIYSIRLPSPEKNYAPALPASTDKVNVAIYDNAFNGVGLRQFQELTEQMEEHLVSAPFKELRIKKIHLTKTLKKIYIANTNGLNAKYIKTGFNILLRVTLNGSTLDISDSRTFFDRLDSYKLVSRAYNLLTSLTETPITLDQQNIPLVLSPEASAFVLREFAEYFKITADRKFGEMPLPSILNIVDDPLLDGGAGSVPFDDEGTQAGEKFLVRKGSFSTY
ncbi:MAG: hypothetical protein GY765_27580, partial [bacterium]|nr:hypothetical protein [bacterium]